VSCSTGDLEGMASTNLQISLCHVESLKMSRLVDCQQYGEKSFSFSAVFLDNKTDGCHLFNEKH